MCIRCKEKLTAHSFYLKLCFKDPSWGCKKCRGRRFVNINMGLDLQKVYERNPETNEIEERIGDRAIRIPRFQRERKGNKFTKQDFEDVYRKFNRNRSNKIRDMKPIRE